MDNLGVVLAHPNSAAERHVAGVCLAAMDELEYRSSSLTIVVQPDPSSRSNVEACAFDGGISVVPELVDQSDQRRLCWVLSEEVAHRYLNEIHGVPHGGNFLDRFAQEGFACWFQCQRMLRDGLYRADDMISKPITEHAPSPSLGHDLGKHTGSALGGSYKSADRLKDWYADPDGQPGFKVAVMDVVTSISVEQAPPQVALEVARAHAQARARGC